MKNPRILIVDDEKNIRDSIVRFLSLEDIEGIPAGNGLSAKRLFEDESFDAAVIDLRMPDMDGMELLNWIRDTGIQIPVIMISAFGEIKDAVEAMKSGARDYIVKPFDPEELVIRLKRLVEEKSLKDQVSLGKRLYTDQKIFITTGAESKNIDRLINKVAGTDSIVLITGESGTGKEVTAKRIHLLSGRSSGPFVPINIGGIPENLLESELFGFEKGAFTGAGSRKPGMIELAQGGTLFLDEIGDMPLSLQVKILRFLQEKKIQRLGSLVSIPVDVRIIAATNRDLKVLIAENRFREDLFFRLNVINIQLPALREMKDDLPGLVGFFIEHFNTVMRKQDQKIKGIAPDALELLSGYAFHGNIRELENMIERAFILAESDMLGVDDFDSITGKKSGNTTEALPGTVEKKGTMREIERETIFRTLKRWEGNRTKAAEELGITRRTLYNKMKEYGIG